MYLLSTIFFHNLLDFNQDYHYYIVSLRKKNLVYFHLFSRVFRIIGAVQEEICSLQRWQHEANAKCTHVHLTSLRTVLGTPSVTKVTQCASREKEKCSSIEYYKDAANNVPAGCEGDMSLNEPENDRNSKARSHLSSSTNSRMVN